jgi:uncharacterized protein YqhQ
MDVSVFSRRGDPGSARTRLRAQLDRPHCGARHHRRAARWLLRGRTLYLHGAEHRAIAALEARRLRDTWEGAVRPSRFSLRCGTNFSALLMPVAIFGGRFWPLPVTALTPLVVSVLALAVTMELWQIVQRSRRIARVVLLPGLGLQRLTTREPRLDETRVALTALAAVLRQEQTHL